MGPLPALPRIHAMPDLPGTGEGNTTLAAARGLGHHLQRGTLYSTRLHSKCDGGTNTFQTGKKINLLHLFLASY